MDIKPWRGNFVGPILAKISRNGCVSESENVKESYFETFTFYMFLCEHLFYVRDIFRGIKIVKFVMPVLKRLLLVKNDRSRTSWARRNLN